MTKGIVSATGRAVGITKYDEFIQTDAAINPATAAGRVINLKGEVVGINTAISSSSGGFRASALPFRSTSPNGSLAACEGWQDPSGLSRRWHSAH